MDIQQLVADDFESLPDRRLALLHGDATISLEIKSVQAAESHAERTVRPFSVILRDRGAQDWFAQGIFRYAHPRHGLIELFTVPIGPDESGMCYQIIFN